MAAAEVTEMLPDNVDVNLTPKDPGSSAETKKNALKKTCASCNMICHSRVKHCSRCGEKFPPGKKDYSKQKESLYRKAKALHDYHKADVIVLIAKKNKRGVSIKSYASPGLAQQFMGQEKDKLKKRPEEGQMVYELFQNFVKGQISREQGIDSRQNPSNDDIMQVEGQMPQSLISDSTPQGDGILQEEETNSASDQIEEDMMEVHDPVQLPLLSDPIRPGLAPKGTAAASSESTSSVPSAHTPQIGFNKPQREFDRSGTRAKVFWPPLSDMPEWGNKWWECDIKFQSKAQLKIIYNGNFEEPDGTRGYNRKGKSTMTVSKKKFLDDWEVLFYD